MSIIALLIGIVIIALLGGTLAVSSTIPFVCVAFAFCFWGSLAILAVSIIGGAIIGIITPAKKDRKAEDGERNQRHGKDDAAICA